MGCWLGVSVKTTCPFGTEKRWVCVNVGDFQKKVGFLVAPLSQQAAKRKPHTSNLTVYRLKSKSNQSKQPTKGHLKRSLKSKHRFPKQICWISCVSLHKPQEYNQGSLKTNQAGHADQPPFGEAYGWRPTRRQARPPSAQSPA